MESINDEWIDKCIELNLSGKQKQVNQSIDILKEKLPKRLFKYKPLNDYALECLDIGALYMSRTRDLNDPYEFDINFQLDINDTIGNLFTKKEHEGFLGFMPNTREIEHILNSDNRFSALVEVLNQNGRDMAFTEEEFRAKMIDISAKLKEEEFVAEKKLLRVVSFSERNDSTIMWSHYADNHKGICIEYDPFEFNFEYPIFPVNYSDYLVKADDYEKQITLAKEKALFKTVRTKATNWKYEEEWRMIYLLPDDNNLDQIKFAKAPVPKAIYVGSKFIENTRYRKLLLDRIIGRLNIPVYQMRLHHSEYKMVPIQLQRS